MRKLLKRLVREEQGQDVIEYALIAAAISVIAIPIIPGIGNKSGHDVDCDSNGPQQSGNSVEANEPSLGRPRPDVPGDVVRSPIDMTTLLKQLCSDETGQDVIEYALLTASIGLAGIATWPAIATSIGEVYEALDTNTQNLWEVPNPGGGT